MILTTVNMPLPPRVDPIKIDAIEKPSNPEHAAALVFLHGLGDDAEGFENIARQFQGAHKLDHMHWVIPNGLDDRDLMQRAWYKPSPLRPLASSRPELDDPEDEDGLIASRTYLEELIDELVEKRGIPAKRIVIGGFSQGCAVSLFTALTSSKYAGKLAGICGLAGYLPLADRIEALREQSSLSAKADDAERKIPYFIMRGNRDVLVPRRFLRICTEKLVAIGIPDDAAEVHEYEVGHAISAACLRDMCGWLERILPPLA